MIGTCCFKFPTQALTLDIVFRLIFMPTWSSFQNQYDEEKQPILTFFETCQYSGVRANSTEDKTLPQTASVTEMGNYQVLLKIRRILRVVFYFYNLRHVTQRFFGKIFLLQLTFSKRSVDRRFFHKKLTYWQGLGLYIFRWLVFGMFLFKKSQYFSKVIQANSSQVFLNKSWSQVHFH